MRPTFLAFQTAHRAIATSQILLDTAGNNLANVQTEGYSRQRVDINSVSNGGAVQKFKPMNVTAGGGVEAKRVVRVRDQFLDARYRMQNSEDSEYAAILSGLKDLENVLDQTSAKGLLTEIANLKKALDPMLENPPSNDMAMVVRNAAQKLASLLNTYAQNIENVRDQQIYDLQNVHIDTNFNSIVQNIAALNKQINEEIAHGNTPNELLDERDMLFDKLSGLANVRVNITPKWLSSSLKVEDVEVSIVDEKTNTKIDLIKNNAYNTFSLAKNTNGTVRMEVNSAFGNENLPYGKDVTPFLTSGTLGGALNVINGAGAEFSASYTTSTALVPPWTDASNSFRGTLYYRGMLDAFAANLARTLNGVNDYNPNGALPRSVLVSSKDAGYDTTHANYNNIYDSSNPAYDADLYRQAVEDYRNALASGNPALIAAARPAYEQVLVSNPANKTQYDDKDPFYDQTLDPSNTSGTPPFDSTKYWDTINAYVPEPRPLFSTIDGSTTVTSANIRISQEWLDNPMRLTVTQPGDLSEGENVGRMIVAIEKGFAFYPDGDPTKPMLFNGTLEEYFTGVNATLGLDVSLYDNYSETSKQVMTTLFTARESVSGVSLDEEGVALMAYQKSYNAAVRFFTVLDEAVNKIINEMGLAGR